MHPRWLTDELDAALIDLWDQCGAAGNGWGGMALPFAGGVAEQPACTMASLRIIAGAYRALTQKGG